MKCAVFYEKNVVKIEERPLRPLHTDEVLIRVHACGICGTDEHIFQGDEGAAKTPRSTVLGHEFAGEIAQIGSAVTAFSKGDHVCVDPNKLCGHCDFCRRGVGHFCEQMVGIGTTVDGGFSEYCIVPVSQVYKVSPELPYEAAAMSEPVSCCLHGIRLCNIKCGDTVAVIGCGMIGLLMLQLAKLSGAAQIIAIEPIGEKRAAALSLGADLAIDPRTQDVQAVLQTHSITQIDAVIECVGKPETLEEAIAIAGKNSVVMMFGLTKPLDTIRVKPFELFKKEITLRSSFINPYTFPDATRLIESGRLDVRSMIYQTAPLEALPKLLADPKALSKGKYIITL